MILSAPGEGAAVPFAYALGIMEKGLRIMSWIGTPRFVDVQDIPKRIISL